MDQIFDCLSFIAFPLYRKNNKDLNYLQSMSENFCEIENDGVVWKQGGGIFNRLSIFQLDGVEPSNNLEIIFSTLIEEFTSLKKQK